MASLRKLAEVARRPEAIAPVSGTVHARARGMMARPVDQGTYLTLVVTCKEWDIDATVGHLCPTQRWDQA